MSKELEALDKIAIVSEILVEVSKSHITPEDAIEEIRACNISGNYFIIKQSLTPPTADELCKEYYNFKKTPLIYDKLTKTFEEIKGGRARGRIIARLRCDNLDILHILPPRLIKRIAQFYEGEVK